MNFTAPKRAGEIRRISRPSERINMARALLRPRHIEAGLISAADFNAGYEDALAGKPWRLKPADLTVTDGDVEAFSYMKGYRAGEIARERNSGGNNAL